MHTEWVCPQCETVNKNTDICIVCSMSRMEAAAFYESRKAAETPAERREISEPTSIDPANPIDPSKIKLRFRDDDTEPVTPDTGDKTHVTTAVISILLSVLGILFSSLSPTFSFFASAVSIVFSAVSLKREANYAAAIGLILGILGVGLAFASAIMNIQ